MTINVASAHDWSRHNGGQDDPRYNKCSPNLIALKIEMQHLWSVGDLGCYGERNVRAGVLPSAHSHGAAIDLRYLEQIGRGRFINEVIPWLVANSEEFHVGAIHDYIGCTIWHAARTTNVFDAYTAWWRVQTPNPSTGMGQAWAGWVHIETTEPGWADATPVIQRLTSHTPTTPPPPLPEEDDMAIRLISETKGEWIWSPGGRPQPFKSPGDRDAIVAAGKYEAAAVSDVQLVALFEDEKPV